MASDVHCSTKEQWKKNKKHKYRISLNTAQVSNWAQPRIEPGSTYPSKLIEPTVIESQPSLDYNPGDFGHEIN